MSELKGAKMEGSKVPAEEIKNPDLVAAIEKMQDDNTTENINKMIDEVMKAKFILPAMNYRILELSILLLSMTVLIPNRNILTN